MLFWYLPKNALMILSQQVILWSYDTCPINLLMTIPQQMFLWHLPSKCSYNTCAKHVFMIQQMLWNIASKCSYDTCPANVLMTLAHQMFLWYLPSKCYETCRTNALRILSQKILLWYLPNKYSWDLPNKGSYDTCQSNPLQVMWCYNVINETLYPRWPCDVSTLGLCNGHMYHYID